MGGLANDAIANDAIANDAMANNAIAPETMAVKAIAHDSAAAAMDAPGSSAPPHAMDVQHLFGVKARAAPLARAAPADAPAHRPRRCS